jgi:hypothetical protein
MCTADQTLSAKLHGEALLTAKRPELQPLIDHLREVAQGRDDIRTEDEDPEWVTGANRIASPPDFQPDRMFLLWKLPPPVTLALAPNPDLNLIDERIARLIHRPMTAGHAGEWIASQIFKIDLEPSAMTPAYDGRFKYGALAGMTVNIKWYLKQEGLLDMTTATEPDYYLVMTGPRGSTTSSSNTTRPWVIDYVYLFDSHCLSDELRSRGSKIGVGTSLRQTQWKAAEIYPVAVSTYLPLDAQQVALLQRFGSDEVKSHMPELPYR